MLEAPFQLMDVDICESPFLGELPMISAELSQRNCYSYLIGGWTTGRLCYSYFSHHKGGEKRERHISSILFRKWLVFIKHDSALVSSASSKSQEIHLFFISILQYVTGTKIECFSIWPSLTPSVLSLPQAPTPRVSTWCKIYPGNLEVVLIRLEFMSVNQDYGLTHTPLWMCFSPVPETRKL